MARSAEELSNDPAVVVTNPDDVLAGVVPCPYRRFARGPEPEIESIEAADALRLLRVDAVFRT